MTALKASTTRCISGAQLRGKKIFRFHITRFFRGAILCILIHLLVVEAFTALHRGRKRSLVVLNKVPIKRGKPPPPGTEKEHMPQEEEEEEEIPAVEIPSLSLDELLQPSSSCDVKQMGPTAMAYIGDVVFELFIRSRCVWPTRRTADLHEKVVRLVRGMMCNFLQWSCTRIGRNF